MDRETLSLPLDRTFESRDYSGLFQHLNVKQVEKRTISLLSLMKNVQSRLYSSDIKYEGVVHKNLLCKITSIIQTRFQRRQKWYEITVLVLMITRLVY